MTREPDLYAILGVVPGSQHVVIEAAYKALMQRYAPEADRSVNAAKKRADLKAAFKVLGDSASRAAYDKKRGYRAPAVAASPRVPRVAEQVPIALSGDNKASPTKRGKKGAHPALWILGAIFAFLFIIVATSPNSSNSAANNVVNVDENLATTGMNMSTDRSGADAHAVDTNATEINAPDAASNAKFVDRASGSSGSLEAGSIAGDVLGCREREQLVDKHVARQWVHRSALGQRAVPPLGSGHSKLGGRGSLRRL